MQWSMLKFEHVVLRFAIGQMDIKTGIPICGHAGYRLAIVLRDFYQTFFDYVYKPEFLI